MFKIYPFAKRYSYSSSPLKDIRSFIAILDILEYTRNKFALTVLGRSKYGLTLIFPKTTQSATPIVAAAKRIKLTW